MGKKAAKTPEEKSYDSLLNGLQAHGTRTATMHGGDSVTSISFEVSAAALSARC